MPYNINKTDGTALVTIPDGVIDNRTATSLILLGKNVSNYGEYMAENMVALLENFANSSSPPNPLAGQLWWNTSQKRLTVYTGTEFKSISGSTSQGTAPVTPVIGDLWWNSISKQLYCYDGTTPYSVAGWILIGPERDGSGTKWEQIVDSVGSPRTVVSIFVSNVRSAIISTAAGDWTPLTTIPGFTIIRPGHNIRTSDIFNGTANNSSRLAGLDSTSYLRSDTNSTTTGALTIQNNLGLTIGNLASFSITTQTGGSSVIRTANAGASILFQVSTSNVLTVNGATNSISANSLQLTSTAANALFVVGGISVAGAASIAGDATFGARLLAPTAPVGTANTWVATTEFVANNSGLFRNRIYAGDSFIDVNDTGTGNASIVMDGVTVATASASGFNLTAGATAITQPDSFNGTGNARIATTQFVKTASQWWGGSKKFVSTSAPQPGVNDIGSVDGDFWFQYTP